VLPSLQALADLSRQLFAPLRFDWTDTPLLPLPAVEAWRLYEIWCLFQVAQRCAPEDGRLSQGRSFTGSRRGCGLLLQTGQASDCVSSAAGKIRRACMETPPPPPILEELAP